MGNVRSVVFRTLLSCASNSLLLFHLMLLPTFLPNILNLLVHLFVGFKKNLKIRALGRSLLLAMSLLLAKFLMWAVVQWLPAQLAFINITSNCANNFTIKC